MHPIKPIFRYGTLLLALVVFTSLLAGCGQSPAAQNKATSSNPVNNATSTATPNQITFDANNLHFVTPYSMFCESSRSVVLDDTTNLTHSESEIASATAYLRQFEQSTWSQRTGMSLPISPLTLANLSVIQKTPERCLLHVQVTNNNNSSITLTSANVQVSKITPRPVQGHFGLVDACSLFSCQPQVNTVQMDCRGVFANVNFNIVDKTPASEGQTVSGAIITSNGCGQAGSLDAGKSVSLFMNITFALSPGDVNYTLTPTITYTLNGTPMSATLSNMTGVKEFTSPSHFSCYGVNKQNTFVLEDSHGNGPGIVRYTTPGYSDSGPLMDCL